MSYLDPSILDRGLFSVAKRATRLLISEAEHAAYGEPAIGWGLPIVIGPENAPDGRQIRVQLAAPGDVLASGTASFYALVDDPGQQLLAANALANPLEVEVGNSFTLQSFTIVMPGLPEPEV